MLPRTALFILLSTLVPTAAAAEDWPTYRHDNRRSGVTGQQLAAANLQQGWVYRSLHPPQPAWAGPAKCDAYHNFAGLRSMRDYDGVFHVAAAGGSLYFGSSADDSVYCLDAADGKQKWSFTTDGPVRIAPTVAGDRVYFGSDDGCAYCLQASDGRLVWKYRPAADNRRILNNGRMISPWPCRTGVTVDGGTAYFAAGMLPWKESYLCAVDAASGKPQGPGRYAAVLKDVVTEGAMAALPQRLFVPQGRTSPRAFNRIDGKPLGDVAGGGGGCFLMLTDDGHVMQGPGNKTGWINEADAATLKPLALLGGVNATVVAGDSLYLLTDRKLSAAERSLPKIPPRAKKPPPRKVRWSVPCEYPCCLIMAGDTLFAGGEGGVAAFAANDGKLLLKAEVDGKARGLAVAGDRLFVSTDEGAIYCFQPGPKPKPGAVKKPQTAAQSPPKRPERLVPAMGPCLRFTGEDSITIRWETEKPSPSTVIYGREDSFLKIEEPTPKTKHEIPISGLRRNRVYDYYIRAVVDGKLYESEKFECDTFFNFLPAAVPDRPNPYGEDTAAGPAGKAAQRILSETGLKRGICLVAGCTDGRLAYELVRRSGLRAICVDTDAGRVAAAREKLKLADVYGARVAVHRVDTLQKLPFIGCFANLIVSERMLLEGQCPMLAAEVLRLLRPGGGIALLGQPRDAPNKLSGEKLRAWSKAAAAEVKIADDARGLWVRLVRPPLENIGEWSHQYGRADNSAYGGESLQGAQSTSELAVQWVGRPGPRCQADRNGRKPSPLSTSGRLFLQGLQRIVAIDAYNGTVLWSLEIPPFLRFNVPRDCSNWCADADHVFAAVKNRCWQIDAASGALARFHTVVPGPRADWQYEWGYVGRRDNQIIGSAVKAASACLNFWGRGGWYDGGDSIKVCSDNLFALDKTSAETQWTYTGGVIINSSITMADQRIYFVECRHGGVLKSSARQIGSGELWKKRFMVAIDANNGRKLWEEPLEDSAPAIVFYLAHSGGKLVLVSNEAWRYHVRAFGAADGAPLWHVNFDGRGHHGGHMSRPAIVGDTVYVRPWIIDLASGEHRKTPMLNGGCGTYALTDRAALFRSGTVTMCELEGGKRTNWARLRPGCWLSTIPAAGMVLSPEAGGGCTCGSWMETSIAFTPREADQ